MRQATRVETRSLVAAIVVRAIRSEGVVKKQGTSDARVVVGARVTSRRVRAHVNFFLVFVAPIARCAALVLRFFARSEGRGDENKAH